jgi:hypothetical protein
MMKTAKALNNFSLQSFEIGFHSEILIRCRVPSVGICNDFRLDSRGTGIRFPTAARSPSVLHKVQTGYETPSVFYPVATRSPFSGSKAIGE